jgi:hypothetical protein
MGLVDQSKMFFRLSGGCSESIRRHGESWKGLSGTYWGRRLPKSATGTTSQASRREAALRLALLGMSPLEFAREVLGFRPDPPQARVLERAPQVRQIKLNCSRQWGKSTVAAVLAVHRLVMQPGSTVLIVGPGARQSGETLRKVADFLAVMGVKTRGDGVNRHSKVLPNGSRIVGLPAVEGTTRGFSAVSMLIVDEAARVPDEVCLGLLPSLAVSNGDLILLSTPRGRRGFFYREMSAEGETGQSLVHTGPVTEGKRIPEEFLERERARGEAYFRQEYMCEFVETGRFLLDEKVVKAMSGRSEEAWGWI